MKTSLLISLLFLIGCISDQPEFSRVSYRSPFIKHFGVSTKPVPGGVTSSFETFYMLTVDRFENIIAVGRADDAFISSAGGGGDGIVMKFDKHGNILWGFQLSSIPTGDKSGLDPCWVVTTDRDGNIYCGGSVTGSKVLGAQKYGGVNDAFVLKLNSQGEFQWINQYGTTGDEGCYNIAISNSGALYCASGVRATVETGAGIGVQDMWVMRINSQTGAVIWHRQLGPNNVVSRGGLSAASAAGTDNCGALVIDRQENLYCLGVTTGNLADTNGSGTSNDIAIWKLNSSGETLALIQYGSSQGSWTTSNENIADAMIDSQGNIIGSGQTDGTVLGNNPASSPDQLLLKISSSTFMPLWKNQLGSEDVGLGSNDWTESACRIGIAPNGDILCGSSTTGSLGDNNAQTGIHLDIFVTRHSSTGQFLDILQFGVSTAAQTGKQYDLVDTCDGFAVDTSGNIYCAGGTENDFYETHNAGRDAIIFRIGSDLDPRDL